MMGSLRRLKIAYSFYNFFHRKQLAHNLPLFKKYGLKKTYFSPLSSKDFVQLTAPATEEDRPDIKASTLYKSVDGESKKSILAFEENGFCVLRNYLSSQEVRVINNEVDKLLADKKVGFNSSNKLMFTILHSSLIRSLGEEPKLKDFLRRLINGKPVLFQSINFLMGSEQRTHSDSIHMTTFPLGGLLGVWIALDDITEDNGPLHYYPGSHKLPYYLNADYNNEGSSLFTGEQSYAAYEDMIAGKIKELGLKKQVFTAKKGDMLIWHANLFHGGEPHKDKKLTRRSMVLHYFKKGVICYHEITQRPALIRSPF